MDENNLLFNFPLELITRGYKFVNLKEELLFYKGILNEIPAFVHIRNQQTGKIIWWNAEWERMLPLQNDGIPTDIESFLKKVIHPDDLILLQTSNDHYQHKNVPGFGGIIRVRLPGEESWSWLMGISRVIQKNAKGVPLKTLVVFLDFTHATHTEQQTREALREVLRRGRHEVLGKITKREKQVLHLLVQGFNNDQIAKQLYISHHTVESHRKNIRIKLSVKSTSELISLAKDLGI